MRLLLAGFKPFGGASVNPSQLLSEALLRDPPRGCDFAALVLPVTYTGAWPALARSMVDFRPDMLLGTGLWAGLAGFAVERLAVNLDDGPPDNDGEQRIDRPILPDAPLAYAATLPVRAMAAAAQAASVPASLSLSAGTFLCNHVFFRACHTAGPAGAAGAVGAAGAGTGRTPRVGFIHVPLLPEQDATRPSLPLAQTIAGMRAVIAALLATS